MRLLTTLIIGLLTMGSSHGFQLHVGAHLIGQGKNIVKLPAGGAAARERSVQAIKNKNNKKSPLFHKQLLSATAADNPPPTEPWTKPRLHNNALVRSAALLAALALAGLSAPFGKLSSTAMATLHLLSFATWFGTVFYTTFIAGITMFKALPRQTFGKLQSKLFPKYFSLCSLMIVLQLITLNRLPGVAGIGPTRVLSLSLAMTLLNQFLLEPKSTKIMFERYDLENSDDPKAKESSEYKKLAASFGKMHGMSSLTNLIALIGAAVHGVYLSSALVM